VKGGAGAVEVSVHDDAEAASQRAAELLARTAAAGHQLALCGGTTPRRAYELAVEGDWSRATVWFSDERCVPPDHPDSNFGMTEAALLSRLSVRPEVVRMEGELGPDAGAGAYEAEIRSRLGGDPRWNLLLLGMGGDGHVASLFPGKPALEERGRLAVGVPEAGMEPQLPRISLTLPAIDAARAVVLLVTGSGKADMVARAFGPSPDEALPVTRVDPRYGSFTVILDEAAAAEL